MTIKANELLSTARVSRSHVSVKRDLLCWGDAMSRSVILNPMWCYVLARTGESVEHEKLAQGFRKRRQRRVMESIVEMRHLTCVS